MTRQNRRSLLSTFFVLLCMSLLAAGCAQSGISQGAPPAPPIATKQIPNPPPLQLPRIHPFKLPGKTASTSTHLLTYHRGPVMHTTSTTYAIFWEPPVLPDGFPTHVSSTYNGLIQRYFQDIGGSGVYQVNTQYYDTAAHIANNSTLGGVWIDHSPYPLPKCFDPLTPHGCLSDAQIQDEVTKAMQVNHWSGGFNHLFFVYTSLGEGSCYDVSSCAFTQFCAYHSYYNTSNQTILYANMPYAGTVRDCVVKTSPNNDSDADSTISVSSHEHMEAVTDAHLDAWYDIDGNENGDKCAWNFGSVSLDGGKANVQWNGHYYIVQQEWSNAIADCTLKG
jgi:hypothetical protein